ncbi:hypothetical protein RUM43_002072, partial [Polyplax serrata]
DGWKLNFYHEYLYIKTNVPTSEKGENTVASARDEGSGGIRRSAIEPDCLRSRFSV